MGQLTDSTVLVTGGGGFIGSHLVDALVDDNEVRVLDDFSSGKRSNLPEEGVEVFEGDVRDEELLATAMEDVDVVFHEAAVVSVTEAIEQPMRSHDVNSTATLAVLEAARREDARAVLASSAAIYGYPDEVPIPETHSLNPTSPYGLQKLTLDRYAAMYHDLYGVETVPLRYFNVYGPRSVGGPYAGVIDVFRRQATAGDDITVEGDGTQTRDFVHVSDVVEANLLAATTDNVGEAYNVATGDTVEIRELAAMIRDLVGSDSEVVHVDPRPGDIAKSGADTTKARKSLGFEATVSLEDGLADLLDSTASSE